MNEHHEEYREDMRSNCERCHDAFVARIDELEKKNVELEDSLVDIAGGLAAAQASYAELVETVSKRTDQARATL